MLYAWFPLHEMQLNWLISVALFILAFTHKQVPVLASAAQFQCALQHLLGEDGHIIQTGS